MSKMLKRIVGGMATGAGNYLVQKAQINAQTAREERLYQRELALANVTHQQGLERIDRQGEWQIADRREVGAQSRLTDRERAGHQLTETRERIQGELSKADKQAQLEKDLVRLRAQVQGREDRETIRLREELESKKNPPVEVIKTDFGSVVYFKNGNMRALKHGHAPTGDSDGAVGVDAFRPGGGKGPQQPTAQQPQMVTGQTQIRVNGLSYWPDGAGGYRDAQGRRFVLNANDELVPR